MEVPPSASALASVAVVVLVLGAEVLLAYLVLLVSVVVVAVPAGAVLFSPRVGAVGVLAVSVLVWGLGRMRKGDKQEKHQYTKTIKDCCCFFSVKTVFHFKYKSRTGI